MCVCWGRGGVGYGGWISVYFTHSIVEPTNSDHSCLSTNNDDVSDQIGYILYTTDRSEI